VQIIATSAEVTPNGGLVRESPPNVHRPVRESPQNYLNSGLGIIIVICQVMYLIPCPQKFNPRFEKSMKLLIFFVALGIDLLQMPVLGLPGDVPGNP